MQMGTDYFNNILLFLIQLNNMYFGMQQFYSRGMQVSSLLIITNTLDNLPLE